MTQPDYSTLRDRITGSLYVRGEDGYVTLATPWDLSVTPVPAAVVEVRTPDDVVQTLRFAAEAGLPVAVQATGHGIASDFAGALLIHTRRLDELTISAEGWARVGAGVKWAPVIEAAAAHGLAPLCGSAPDVSVVGYTTGGGVGPVVRSWGVASDRVRAFDVVTGDGVHRRATPETEPDLFWGLRGGKGSLGVVTAVEFDLVAQPEIYGGGLYLDGTHSRAVLHAWRTWCESLPEEGTTSVALLSLPEGVPGVPPPLTGRFTVCVRFVWTGDPAQGESVFAPMRDIAEPILDMIGTMPFTQIGMVHADPVDPLPGLESSHLLHGFPGAAIDALLEVAGPQAGSPMLMTEVRQLGGAFAREAVPSAMCNRDAAYTISSIGLMFPPIADDVRARAAVVAEAMAPFSTGRVLPNFAAGGGTEGFQRCFDEPTYARLAALADRYDPHRLFRLGQVPLRADVAPSTAAAGV